MKNHRQKQLLRSDDHIDETVGSTVVSLVTEHPYIVVDYRYTTHFSNNGSTLVCVHE